jgi:uncharacterized phage protein (TIGR02218 family)
MRSIPAALQAKLDSGVTTLCRCWRLTRRDGTVQGFTDHDEDITLGALTFRAGTGLTGSEVTSKLGLAIDGSEVSGALASDTLSETDLAAGRYDAAAIETLLVDWSQPALNVLLGKGVLGEVRREGQAFAAEVRGLADRLNQESGRLYTATCSADLGDARCTIDLTNPALRGEGTVTALAGTSVFKASGLDAFADSWFSAGRLTWSSGGERRPRGRGQASPRGGDRHYYRAVAGYARAARRGPRLHRHRRLRQAPRNLPRSLREYAQFPRLSAHSWQ